MFNSKYKNTALLVAAIFVVTQLFGGLSATEDATPVFQKAFNKSADAIQQMNNKKANHAFDIDTYCKGLGKRLESAEAIYEYAEKCQPQK